MGIAALGALARLSTEALAQAGSKDELIGARSEEVRGKKGHKRGRLRHPESGVTHWMGTEL